MSWTEGGLIFEEGGERFEPPIAPPDHQLAWRRNWWSVTVQNEGGWLGWLAPQPQEHVWGHQSLTCGVRELLQERGRRLGGVAGLWKAHSRARCMA